MKIEELKNHLQNNSKNLSNEFKRLFHGRGGVYDEWSFLTIDSIDKILSVALYFEIQSGLETELIGMLKEYIQSTSHTIIILQRRYKSGSPTEVIVGELKEDIFVVENGMKIKLNLRSNQNSGYFADMKNGREFVRENSKDKNVLNLFSYTCAFSIAAMLGGAKSVVNVDMSKSALTTGRANHHLNNLETKNVSFLPYNILKSFSGIRRKGLYELIIIDPPTLQKGSFEASKDYIKIIAKLSQLASDNCTVLACLNSPDLDSSYLIELFKEVAPEFSFVKRVQNLEEFANINEERGLKNLVFEKTASYV
ncbi:class I SAM-dependent methyltransferase [Sulfurimonas sp.]|uniref:class I SAM-dependent methyltransferase n=1 Tax=Sulfurimonas sp. TaxID=2022749 RepID=UPI0025DFB6C2|nr:class I SAM-dependent methyltransferase [Sulfurimonas sp.]MDD5157160.1 class I SAM-dependent methyltransferase [Sulfurimonas sp.]